jgi:hypothetical protein
MTILLNLVVTLFQALILFYFVHVIIKSLKQTIEESKGGDL